MSDVSRAVERHYANLRLTAAFQAQVRAELDDLLKLELSSLGLAKQRLRERLSRLNRVEDQLLELLGDPDWPRAKLKQKLAAIEKERSEIDRQLHDTRSKLDTGRHFFLLALDLLQDPQACYQQSGTDLRRAMNKLIFAKLYVDETGIDRDDLAPGFQEIIRADRGAGDVPPIGPRRSRDAPKWH